MSLFKNNDFVFDCQPLQRIQITFFLLLSFNCLWAAAQESTPNLHLTDLRNHPFSITNAEPHTATVLVFISHECPVTQQYMQLHGQYQSKTIGSGFVREKPDRLSPHTRQITFVIPDNASIHEAKPASGCSGFASHRP